MNQPLVSVNSSRPSPSVSSVVPASIKRKKAIVSVIGSVQELPPSVAGTSCQTGLMKLVAFCSLMPEAPSQCRVRWLLAHSLDSCNGAVSAGELIGGEIENNNVESTSAVSGM